ncbi:hypothetical protein Lser_V15G44525 [Lactuca serriola]
MSGNLTAFTTSIHNLPSTIAPTSNCHPFSIRSYGTKLRFGSNGGQMFFSRSDAMDAFKRLQKRDVTFGVDRPAKVSFADSFIDPGDEIMAQGEDCFYIDGLPASWYEGRVWDLLKKYGEVVKIELARNMTSIRRKDYGFITIGTHDSALTCGKGINNEEFGDNEKKEHEVKAKHQQLISGVKPPHLALGIAAAF